MAGPRACIRMIALQNPPLFSYRAPGCGLGNGGPNEVEFAPREQFPLHLFPGLHADGGSKGEGDGDVEAGLLGAGTDDLDFYGIFCLHGRKIPYKIASVKEKRL